MFKKVLSIGLMALAPSLFAHELTSFNAIINALEAGKQVKVVMQTAKCKIDDPNETKLPPSSVLLKVETALFNRDQIGFDGTKYSRPLPDVPNGLIHRASFILEKNGHFNGLISMFDAVTNLKPANRKDITVDCQLGENVKFFKN